jgi:uncharacterized paraquat-inducible protein A
MPSSGGQISFDLDYDERTARLASEFAIMMAPHMVAGATKEVVMELASRMAVLAGRRYAYFGEPEEPIRCHTCDAMTVPKNRVRVVVCPRCSFEGRSPGSRG